MSQGGCHGRPVETFKKWRLTPAPKRGLVIRDIGGVFRKYKEALGRLITLETGKIVEEGMGEVQETIGYRFKPGQPVE